MGGRSGRATSFGSEGRMSAASSRFRLLVTVAILSLGATLAGCTGSGGDPGADRSQQQSQELRDRISTTQTDR